MNETVEQTINDFLTYVRGPEASGLIAELGRKGFVIVPKEPTDVMIKAGADKHDGNDFMSPADFDEQASDIYCAMIAAAQEPK